MEQTLRAALLGEAALSALVGTKVDWNIRPQGDALPGVSLVVISDVPEQGLRRPTGWHDARVHVECWGRTPKEATEVARAAARLLNGYRAGEPGQKIRVFVGAGSGDSETVDGRVVHRKLLAIFVHYQAQ